MLSKTLSAQLLWRDMTGQSSLSPDRFIKSSSLSLFMFVEMSEFSPSEFLGDNPDPWVFSLRIMEPVTMSCG